MPAIEPGTPVDLVATAIRWVDDEPQPGLVEVQLIDAVGDVHRIIDKCAIFDSGDDLVPTTDYPMATLVSCTVVASDDSGAVVKPNWHVESVDGVSEFRMRAVDLLSAD